MTGFINNEIVHKTVHEKTSVPITAHGTRLRQHGTISKQSTNGRAQHGTRRESCPTRHGETAHGNKACLTRHLAADNCAPHGT